MADQFNDHVPIPEELAGNSVGYCYLGGGDQPTPGSIQPIVPTKCPLRHIEGNDGHPE